MKRRIISLLTVILTIGVFAQYSLAHDMWINVEDYTTEIGSPVWISFGFGHYYLCPGTEPLLARYKVKVYMIGPDGNKVSLSAINGWGYSSITLQKEGTYVIVAERKPMFFTKTIEGYKIGKSKKEVKNVIYCKYSAKYAKAIVNVGKAGGKIFSKTFGNLLEIIPLLDPGKIKAGDYFPVKVLFKNRPIKTWVFATYSGFSTDKNVFAYATKTDSTGICKIKIIRSGIWLIKVSHEIPYSNPEVCDKCSFSATLTFEVK